MRFLSVLSERCFYGYGEFANASGVIKLVAYPHQTTSCRLRDRDVVMFSMQLGTEAGNSWYEYETAPMLIELSGSRRGQNFPVVYASASEYVEQLLPYNPKLHASVIVICVCAIAIFAIFVVHFGPSLFKWWQRKCESVEYARIQNFVDEQVMALLCEPGGYAEVHSTWSVDDGRLIRRPGLLIDAWF